MLRRVAITSRGVRRKAESSWKIRKRIMGKTGISSVWEVKKEGEGGRGGGTEKRIRTR